MLKVSDIMNIILVVDENEGNLALLRDMLEEPRRIVITQKSGGEALRLIGLGMHIDLVVTSAALPDIEAFQLLIELKRAAPSLPVITMLSEGPDAENLKALSPGIFEYVERPVIKGQLKRTVDTLLMNTPAWAIPFFLAGGAAARGMDARTNVQPERSERPSNRLAALSGSAFTRFPK